MADVLSIWKSWAAPRSPSNGSLPDPAHGASGAEKRLRGDSPGPYVHADTPDSWLQFTDPAWKSVYGDRPRPREILAAVELEWGEEACPWAGRGYLDWGGQRLYRRGRRHWACVVAAYALWRWTCRSLPEISRILGYVGQHSGVHSLTDHFQELDEPARLEILNRVARGLFRVRALTHRPPTGMMPS